MYDGTSNNAVGTLFWGNELPMLVKERGSFVSAESLSLDEIGCGSHTSF
jgi:hypothetical protein